MLEDRVEVFFQTSIHSIQNFINTLLFPQVNSN